MPEQKSTWCIWSTHESVQNEVPSVTAILETIIAVPLYWWIALRVGVVLPLLVSAVVAPLVLLRSDASVALGLKWFLQFEKGWLAKFDEVFGYLTLVPVSVAIRIGATLFYLRSGIRALPANFRRLVLCTSPAQLPELVPGLEASGSEVTFSATFEGFLEEKRVYWPLTLVVYWPLLLVLMLIPLLPAWLYRFTIKSTCWFWWPLAFLGGDLERVQNPTLFHWKVMGSLWAKTGITLAIISLLAFVAANLNRLVFGHNDLLIPIGRLLLIDWNSLWSWQVCALLVSVLSIAIVLLVNDVSGEYRIAQDTDDGKLLEAAKGKYGWIERLTRFRFLVLLAFWGIVGTHAVLYANSQQCWFSPPPPFQKWAQDIYGDCFPRSNECLLLP